MAKFIVNKAEFDTKAAAIAESDRIFAKYGIVVAVEFGE